MTTIDKLHNAQHKNDMRITKLRQQQQAKELGELREKPNISSNYQPKRTRTPVHMRDLRETDEKKEEYARLNREKQEKQILAIQSECTFRPAISSNASPNKQGENASTTPRNPMDTVESLLLWKKERDLDILRKVTSQQLDGNMTFKPTLNPTSEKLAGERTRTPEAMYKRLVGLKQEQERERIKKLEEEQKGWFSPLINKGRRSSLNNGEVRKKIHETDTLHYFKQEHAPALVGMPQSARKDYIRDNAVHAADNNKKKFKSETKPPLAPHSSQYSHIRSRYKEPGHLASQQTVGTIGSKNSSPNNKQQRASSARRSVESQGRLSNRQEPLSTKDLAQQRKGSRAPSQQSNNKSRKSVQFDGNAKRSRSASQKTLSHKASPIPKPKKSRSNSKKKLTTKPSSDLVELQELLARSVSRASNKSGRESPRGRHAAGRQQVAPLGSMKGKQVYFSEAYLPAVEIDPSVLKREEEAFRRRRQTIPEEEVEIEIMNEDDSPRRSGKNRKSQPKGKGVKSGAKIGSQKGLQGVSHQNVASSKKKLPQTAADSPKKTGKTNSGGKSRERKPASPSYHGLARDILPGSSGLLDHVRAARGYEFEEYPEDNERWVNGESRKSKHTQGSNKNALNDARRHKSKLDRQVEDIQKFNNKETSPRPKKLSIELLKEQQEVFFSDYQEDDAENQEDEVYNNQPRSNSPRKGEPQSPQGILKRSRFPAEPYPRDEQQEYLEIIDSKEPDGYAKKSKVSGGPVWESSPNRQNEAQQYSPQSNSSHQKAVQSSREEWRKRHKSREQLKTAASDPTELHQRIELGGSSNQPALQGSQQQLSHPSKSTSKVVEDSKKSSPRKKSSGKKDVLDSEGVNDAVKRKLKKLQIKEVFTNLYFE